MIARRSIRSSVAVLAAWVCAVALLVAAPVALSSSIAPAPAAAAASGSDFNPGNIISDAAFYDSNAMGSPEIQAFMERQVRSCASGFTCLKDYRQNTDNRPSDRYCNGYEGRGNESASTIIDRVARSCGISQKVILVLLEKEQSLVTWNAPTARAYAAATGQGCPDTAPCDSATLGFFYQVYYAARQYKIYKAFPQDFGYQAGRWNNILYHPYNNCGTQRVYIENQATAGLYIYTPYVPNQAALNNLYGTGDTCSSYGNRNFWRLYTDWFGSTQPQPPANPSGPFGSVDAVQARPGTFEVSGWAADPDTSNPIAVHVYVNGVGYAFTADGDRADVGAALPHLGSRHGFSVTVPASAAGSNEVCVYGINVGPGGNSQIGCSKVAALAGSPVGNLEGVSATAGGVTVGGWALDPDTRDSVDVHVYVGSTGTALRADANRPDIAAAYPLYGAAHGFGATLPAAPGTYDVCAYAINTGFGSNVLLGCRNVTVTAPSDQGRAPFGVYEGLSADGQTLTVSGWTIDPDTAAPIRVRVDAGGVITTITADNVRADVGAAYPSFGSQHGFVAKIQVPVGETRVCVTALNNGRGGDTSLGCKTITARLPDLGRAPIGVLEGVTVRGATVAVSGWALDEDTSDAISVHLYVGSRGVAYNADLPRADVGAVYPAQGPNHGFSQVMNAPPGRSDVCAYAINNGAGGNTLLGCRAIVVGANEKPPFGNLEAVSVAGRNIVVDGWAIDPDTPDPIAVHVYISGVGTAHTADRTRADVAGAYPASGPQHGFSVTRAVSPGTYDACVYAINNNGNGPHTLLGCRQVRVP